MIRSIYYNILFDCNIYIYCKSWGLGDYRLGSYINVIAVVVSYKRYIYSYIDMMFENGYDKIM